jgi:hypothetical protein
MNIPGNNEPIVNQDNDITNSEDIHDSPKDQEQLKSETAVMDLPEVKDIPGQENIEPMPLGELADTTISSDDEEGVGVLDFEDEDDEAIINSPENITNQGSKDATDANTAIEDGAQLKGADNEQITNAKDQATNDMGADEEA